MIYFFIKQSKVGIFISIHVFLCVYDLNPFVIFVLCHVTERSSRLRGKSLKELWVTTFLPEFRLTANLNLCPIHLKLLVHVL